MNGSAAPGQGTGGKIDDATVQQQQQRMSQRKKVAKELVRFELRPLTAFDALGKKSTQWIVVKLHLSFSPLFSLHNASGCSLSHAREAEVLLDGSPQPETNPEAGIGRQW